MFADTSHGQVRGRALRPVPWPQGRSRFKLNSTIVSDQIICPRYLSSLLFFQELKEIGGTEELEKEVKRRIKRKGTQDAVQ
jgi:hypothetical protein